MVFLIEHENISLLFWFWSSEVSHTAIFSVSSSIPYARRLIVLAISALYAPGGIIGVLTAGYMRDKGSINIAVLLVARFILLHHWMWDWNDGVLTPIFHAEISLPMACLSANMGLISFSCILLQAELGWCWDFLFLRSIFQWRFPLVCFPWACSAAFHEFPSPALVAPCRKLWYPISFSCRRKYRGS